MSTGPQDELFRRYLGILGWVGDPGLHELVSSHLIKVPYENVSTLLRSTDPATAGSLPDTEEFLRGVADMDLGGLDLTIALNFAELLRFLGYEVELLGADVGGVPRGRAVCRVRFEDVAYLVDVGYGAPFYHPISLEALPLQVPHGELQYVVDRHVAGAGAVEVTTLRGNQRAQSYVAKPPPLQPDGFAPAAARSLERWQRSLRISRFFASRALEVYDGALVTTHHNITTVAPISGVDELEVIVHELMQLPRLPVREAVEVLRARGVDLFPG
jgi:arylamine N-acetyltransferase